VISRGFAILSRKRDGTDDGNRNGDEQRAGRRHDENPEEACRLSARRPRDYSDQNCERRIPSTELIAKPPHAWPSLFRRAHDLHDLCIPRIGREFVRAKREGRVTVDRAGQDRRTGRLRHHEWFAGQVGFVHDPVAFDNGAIDRADFMRKNHEGIADGDLVEKDLRKLSVHLAVSA
jgi:hypothetical protein